MPLLRPAAALLFCFTLLTGLLYPALVAGFAQLAFHHKANGSLLVREERVVGSELLAQPFSDSRYFWPRPSATTPPYNAAASAGSNLGPLSAQLAEASQERAAILAKYHGTVPPPADMVSASASGLDPDISLEAAEYQAPRVARARNMPEPKLRELVNSMAEGGLYGLLGSQRVNVLKLNMALDEASGSTSQKL